MKKKSFTIWISVIWVLLSLLTVAGATFAWFTFNPATNVEPISSTISDGEVALLISARPNADANPEAEFEVTCVLPQSVNGDLEPISTADLEHFYVANQQNREGISTRFEDGNDLLKDHAIHGTIYLKSLKDDCNVYFNREGMDFGDGGQMLAALRLGIRFKTEAGTTQYIFSLNDMGDVSKAEAIWTTTEKNVVVGSVTADGSPNFKADPAEGLSDYFAVTGAQKLPMAGRKPLCTISANEVAVVEYWLYLEGCDENCINNVQDKEAILQLSFAGVTAK